MSARKPIRLDRAIAKRNYQEEKMRQMKEQKVVRSWFDSNSDPSIPNFVLPNSQFEQMLIFAR